MAPAWKFLTLGVAFMTHSSVLAQGPGSDDPKFREFCDGGLNTGESTVCSNCWEYLDNTDGVEACAVLFSDKDTLDCSDDLNDELTDMNQVLLDMSKVDSENPTDWNKSKGKWSASFILGTTAVPSQENTFGAWRSSVGEISFLPEYLEKLPRRWNFYISKDGDRAGIEVGWSCAPN